MGRRRQAVTIRHVAADAGVSLQTVSRVINNDQSVRAPMREKVQASIDKLGYVPSIAAQRMGGSRSWLILALNDRERTIADWKARQGTDWVDQLLLGGMLECAEHGYRLIFELVDTNAPDIERQLGATIAALQPDGVILTPPHCDDPRIIEAFRKHQIPVARMGSREEGEGLCVAMDEGEAGRLATRYLQDLGHERIGFIAGLRAYSFSSWRVEGWQAQMREAGLATEGLMAPGDFSYETGAQAARELLGRSPRPSAIIASGEQMALAALDVAQELGLRVPEDLSILSFDNTPLVRFTRPPLTAMDQPIADLAARAVRELILGRAGAGGEARVILLDVGLVERGSTAPPRRD
ncbi:LacI family DNA-binding transcriptional regulator [Novosphingobium sp. YJ-S2-02]|uniref:LacI family DNA-binding transcriptional regulator n=1 Tax=Novosphingobium aureum TaxID=2792964 RepID=A0A931H9P6_9SPHN|nr:LacI family DNA-binding transcriptional regulator [Novosphingobium aureum]MBH0111950.1 LacI family DNA-binding transcriptional regulator [Novosphingobium aureum]